MKDNTVWPDRSKGPKQITVCPDCGNRLPLSECPGTSAPVNVPVLPASLVEEAVEALEVINGCFWRDDERGPWRTYGGPVATLDQCREQSAVALTRLRSALGEGS